MPILIPLPIILVKFHRVFENYVCEQTKYQVSFHKKRKPDGAHTTRRVITGRYSLFYTPM